MKIIISILSYALIFVLGACTQNKNDNTAISIKTDSTQANIINAKSSNEPNLQEREAEEVKDSLYLNNIIQKALSIALKKRKLAGFTEKFVTEPDTVYAVETSLVMGYFFSKRYKHLIIHREGVSGRFINIYQVTNKKIEPVLYHHESSMTYIKDTLQDVNGDGYKDFVVDWYGSSGCCLKDFNNVYLYLPQSGKFTNSYEFINPTYSPREKVIRGICYGHAAHTEMYKYRWNGLRVDTIEYIYPDEKHKGYYIKSDALPYEKKHIKSVRLKKVPKEYIGIYGYDWFTGKGYLLPGEE